ncbi:hypothetical protein QUC32_26845 (plasmid) [Novosphingobium resinovorum]|uniref:TetR/AcrR family transcriptional regulator n=1 Tax=Novosphingobium TaxID=165696 RepID=UPI001B3C4FB8|nr:MULTISPECIES: hypothetical protein [Novosphingobium]MBF7015328.1 TetR/AcrR family transcriptional regulator [Novosphingobium sp. HR1a]WJM30005.1 hypothetical protein QUC32_26845 [Novosphingobium resinovorum]
MRTERQQVIADAAVQTLAEKGARGLTHRAVDQAAGLPASSTSYYCKTREALLELAMDSVLGADFQDAQDYLFDDGSVNFDALLSHFSHPSNRQRGLARFELFLEAARNPHFRKLLADYRRRLVTLIAARMTQNGVADAERATQRGMVDFETRLFHILIFPDEDVAPGS